MANAVEDALSRASGEQRARAQQVIEEARRNIRLVSSQQMEDITPSGADSIARHAQVIEEAKRSIPFEAMQHVEEIGPPMHTPSTQAPKSNIVHLHPDTQSNIETIEQGGGNNYLNENAIDRAQQRPSQAMPPPEQQRVHER